MPVTHVAVRLRYYGRGKGSGAEIETEMYHQVTTFRDGTMVRIEYFTSWAEALEAAGLREGGPAPRSPGLESAESPSGQPFTRSEPR
jgi:hypothetical protein